MQSKDHKSNFGRNSGKAPVRGQLEQAMAALRAEDIDGAEALLEQMLETHRQVPQVHLALARCSIWREQYEMALESIQTALSLKEDLPVAYNLRGEVHAALGEDVKAVDDFQRALELKPSLVKAHTNLAEFYLGAEDFESARYHCEAALEFEPHKDSLRLLLCKIHEQSGDVVSAQEEAHAAVQANPANVAAYLRQGMISFKQRDLLQAEKAFEGLLQVKPDSMMGYYLLGLSALGLEKFQLAERSFENARELAAEDDMPREATDRIRQQLVLTYLRQGKHQQALVAAKELARESQSKRVLKLLADIYYEMGQYELAAQQYRAIALGANRLSAAKPELKELLELEGEPKEVADAWRAGFARLRSGAAAPEEEAQAAAST